MTVITEDMLRIKRLKKELEDGTDFVFPVGSFLTEGWLYFEQQQQWLEKFILEQSLVMEPVILESKVTILTNQQRQWRYSSKEIQLQLDKIILQLKGESQLFGLFQSWATELISTMAEISRN